MNKVTDFYCDQCRRALTKEEAMDENHAWCDDCESVVVTSHLQIKPWVLGSLVVLVGNFLFGLWI